jgi:tetratricopeptide (TPR) repeat protein
MEDRHWVEALAEAQRMVQLEPGLCTSHLFEGDAYYGMGDFPSAVRSYEMATSLPGAGGDFFVKLGEAYEKVGRVEDAITAMNQAVHTSPGFLEGYLGLGRVLARAGRTGEAREQWQRMLEQARLQVRAIGANAEIDECVRLANTYLDSNPG